MAREKTEKEKDEREDETVTYVVVPLRGARLLCLVAGVALVVQHALTGLLSAPFFGGDAFVWGNVLGAFVVSLGVGTGFGDRLGALAGKASHRPWRLLALGGGLVYLATWALPLVARGVLDRDPDSPLAAAMTFAVILALPGSVLASIVPCVIGELGQDGPGDRLRIARIALRRFALAMLGGLGGLALASFVLRNAADLRVHLWLYGLGASLVAFALVGLGLYGRAAGCAALLLLGSLSFFEPSEIQTSEFRAALTDVLALRGPGIYYANRAEPHVISGTELERKLDIAKAKLKGNDKKIAVLLVVETLKTMGPLNLSGQGLKSLLDIYLPQQSKPLILPFVDRIESVQSDGRRMRFRIVRGLDHCAHFKMPKGPAAPGEFHEFTITDDFELNVVVEGKEENITRLDIGPRHVEPGIVNDTIKTPFICNNVALGFVDACLLSLVVENGQDQVILRVQAQASVGKIQTQVLQVIEKGAVR
ncbi:hypothetical protein HY251_08870 [bacterium]|nr:hypothetical protein [bacterium]